jgi:hypothetical protein
MVSHLSFAHVASTMRPILRRQGPECKAPRPAQECAMRAKPTLEQVLQGPFVDSELKKAWNESDPNAPDVRRTSAPQANVTAAARTPKRHRFTSQALHHAQTASPKT